MSAINTSIRTHTHTHTHTHTQTETESAGEGDLVPTRHPEINTGELCERDTRTCPYARACTHTYTQKLWEYRDTSTHAYGEQRGGVAERKNGNKKAKI